MMMICILHYRSTFWMFWVAKNETHPSCPLENLLVGLSMFSLTVMLDSACDNETAQWPLLQLMVDDIIMSILSVHVPSS